jgi:lactate dehydrogenase-like 2-hydroxyacid dehydrogenase
MTVILSATLPDDLLAQLKSAATVVTVPAGTPPQDVIPAAERAAVTGMLCTLRTKADAALLDAFPNLKIISNYAVGFDNVKIDEASERGVLVCNTPGVLDAAVADLTFGLLLNLVRNMVPLHEFVRSGQWKSGAAPLATDVAGKTLGLLGMGRIGKMVAKRARAFDMDVIYHNRSRDTEAEAQGLARYVARDALFEQSDVLSVHVPLTDATRGSVGAPEFARMKPGAYLINTSRGPVVDEEALIQALRDRRISGAGLDVMTQEPMDPQSPLCGMPNVVLQPHVGSATVETRRAMIALATDNLVRALRGETPKAMVNPAVWAAASGAR